jgi:hypothetical protein
VGCNLLWSGALLQQDPSRSLVVQSTLACGQVVVDGVADQRMDEGQVAPVRQDLAPAQDVKRGRDLLLGLLRQGCHGG